MKSTAPLSLLAAILLSCCAFVACDTEYQGEDTPSTSSTSTTPSGCQDLDADACADASGCIPQYGSAPCTGNGPCTDEAVFIGCVDVDPDPCSGLDEETCSNNPLCQPVYGNGCGNYEANDGLQNDPAPCHSLDVEVYEECIPARQRQCAYDGDCAAGEICVLDEITTDCACAPCAPGEDCPPCNCGAPEPGFVPSGTCQPAPQPTYDCYSDRDCDADEYCNYDLTRPAPAPDEDNCLCECADENTDCDCSCGGAEAPAGGVCTPRDIPTDSCFSDSDCPADEYCSRNDQDDWDEDCACEPCVGDDCPPCDCGDGSRIAPEGTCLPRTTECYQDNDCQDGYVCAWLDGAPEPEPFPCDTNDPSCADEAPEPWPGECVPGEPHNECQSDADCPGGYCEWLDTCDAIDCPPSQSYCVYPSCDDGTEPLCNMVPPTCEDGLILAVRNNCYECVNPDTCSGNNNLPVERIESSGHAQHVCGPDDGPGVHIELHEPTWINTNPSCSEFGQGERIDLFIFNWEALQDGGSIQLPTNVPHFDSAQVCDAQNNCLQPSRGEIVYNPLNDTDRLPYAEGSFYLEFDELGFAIEGSFDVDLCSNETFCG